MLPRLIASAQYCNMVYEAKDSLAGFSSVDGGLRLRMAVP
jgi:hypothetical protein